MFQKIFVVAGHGKSNGAFDPGTVYDGLTEREVTVSVATKVSYNLGSRAIPIGVTENLTVEEKIQAVNDLCKAMNLDHTNSLLISLHVDYYKAASGFAAYFYGKSPKSEKYSQSILSGLSNKIGNPVRWNKPDTDSRFGRLGIVRDTKPLAMLLEMGSIKEDAQLLRDNNPLADAISSEIRYFAQWPIHVQPEPDPAMTQAMNLISSAWHDFDKIERLCIEGKQKLHEANEILRSIS